MSFSIDCPVGGDHAVVPPSGNICVCGTIDDSFDERVLLSSYILVRILPRWVIPPDSPWPGTAADTQGSIQGGFWMATNVPLPSGSSGGAKITVAAWLVKGAGGSGSGGGTTSLPQVSQCYAGGSPPIDTCAICGSGSGGAQVRFVSQLAFVSELEVTIPSGANAGVYRATAVAVLSWHMTIGGATYRLVCAEGANLTIHGPSSSASSTSFEADPFSATFPGDMFEADDEIVVVVA